MNLLGELARLVGDIWKNGFCFVVMLLTALKILYNIRR